MGWLKTTLLEVLGVLCLAFFAFSVWPPACLLVVGVAALGMSWAEQGYPSRRGERP